LLPVEGSQTALCDRRSQAQDYAWFMSRTTLVGVTKPV
jgi:hypothetical protein